MPDSITLKPNKNPPLPTAIPKPKTIAYFAFLIMALAFISGYIRNELALTLLGTVFLIILGYCFLAVLLLGFVHRRRALSLSMSIIPDSVKAGENGELFIKTASMGTNRFWKLPATLIRCELFLETKDGRVIRHFAEPSGEPRHGEGSRSVPGIGSYSSIPIKERGVYFGEQDGFVISDAPGFFRLSLPVEQRSGPRLFALPFPAQESVKLSLKSGGDEQRS